MDTKETSHRGQTRHRPVSQGKNTANKRAGTVQKRRVSAKPTPDVVYIQPGPFNRDRFVIQILSVVAVVLALLFGMSIFFKVDEEKILISGVQRYTEFDVRKASGIQDGENLLTLREPEISGRIIEALPYVTQVRIRIKLPDTVKIEIVESDVVYSLEASDGSWWLMRADGILVEKTDAATGGQHTKVVGVKLASPEVGKQAVALEPESAEEDQTEKPTTVLASEQLSAAISILQNLESNGIIGQMASVDVTNISNIELWYSNRYEIVLGDTTQLAYKIATVKAAVEEMKDYESGVLDVSFTIMEDQVVYTPFS